MQPLRKLAPYDGGQRGGAGDQPQVIRGVYRASSSVAGAVSDPVAPSIRASAVVREHWWSVVIRELQYSPAGRTDKPLLTFKQIAVVVAWTVDVRVKRPVGADYDVPHMASAVRASPRSQAWAWSVS
ncbi:hypothetical protein [Streptomyces neyagawaensis]|uniref:Transposase n=1 Tax=Streptomyces neyagawaensis TaxID=42238 RepID=A0ABV3B1N0_9ACTN